MTDPIVLCEEEEVGEDTMAGIQLSRETEAVPVDVYLDADCTVTVYDSVTAEKLMRLSYQIIATPDNIENRLERAQLLSDLRNNTGNVCRQSLLAAIKDYKYVVLMHKKNNFWLYVQMGRLYEIMGDKNMALSSYQEAKQIISMSHGNRSMFTAASLLAEINAYIVRAGGAEVAAPEQCVYGDPPGDCKN